MRKTLLTLTLIAGLTALTGTAITRAQPQPAPTVSAEDKALAQYYRDAIKTQEADRTQEILALFNDPSPEAYSWAGLPPSLAGSYKSIQAVAGEIPASKKDLDQARATLARLKAYIENCRQTPKAQTFSIPRIDPGTTLAQWGADTDKFKPVTVPMAVAYPKDKPLVPAPGNCQMAWSADALYLKYTIVDATPIAKYTQRDSAVFDDDCVELFLVAKPNPAEYWELNIGRTGGVRDVFIKKTPGKWFGALSSEATLKGLEFAVSPAGSKEKPTGYTVVARVPWADLLGQGAAPKPGDTFPFTVGYSDSFTRPDGTQGQTYYSNIYTFVGYHDVARYDNLKLAQ
jgi:hypothetical protein